MRITSRLDAPDAGWTFVESIIVIAIVVILSGGVAFSSVRYVEQARRASAQSQISAFQLALHSYYLDTGVYPSEAQRLDALWEKPTLSPVPVGWSGPYIERPVRLDPWGGEFVYERPGPGGLPFLVESLGADRMRGGEGNEADIGSAGE